MSVTFGEPDSPVIVDTDSVNLDTNELLGLDEYKWKSPDGKVSVTFGRPKGNASYRVAKVLGERQSANIMATAMLLSVLGIRSINGEEIESPYSEADYLRIMARFGPYDNGVVENWKSPDGSLTVEFGAPRGACSYNVAKILGQSQSGNLVMSSMLMTTLAIRSINGEDIDEPANELASESIMSRFGETEDNFAAFLAHFHGRLVDGLANGTMDSNFNSYVVQWQNALHPDTTQTLKEAEMSGETPEAMERIARNAGMQTAKKSRARRGSPKS